MIIYHIMRSDGFVDEYENPTLAVIEPGGVLKIVKAEGGAVLYAPSGWIRGWTTNEEI